MEKILTVKDYIAGGGLPKPAKWLVMRNGQKKLFYYPDLITFDTEFSTIKQGEDAVGLLYLWQACIGGVCVMGRTLDEWVELVNYINGKLDLNEQKRLICYVHNLSADFCYLQAYFDKWEIMATGTRDVLRAYSSGIEYRCSYRLTNMSLAKFLQAEGVQHQKQDGDQYDYRVLRTPLTPLTDKELYYGLCDVVGLYEAIHALLDKTGDDLTTVPYTSTGYVRRDCRKAMRANPRNRQIFRNCRLDTELYFMYKDAFRGGNTHAYRRHAGHVREKVRSYDISSSYPSAMMYEKYPMGPETERLNCTPQMLDELRADGYGFIISISYLNLRTHTTVPYIALAKCDPEGGADIINDNGRVLFASGWTTMTILDVDYDNINKQYEFDDIKINRCFYHKMDYLPRELRQCVSDYFVSKTTLKGVAGQEYFYMKAKNKLNAIYGMMVTDIIRPDVVYEAGDWSEAECSDHEAALDKYYRSRNNFLSYQWGVYVTAYARARLQEAIDICAQNMIYCDTDSVKFIDSAEICHDISAINARILGQASGSDIPAIAYTKDGKKQVLGLWDDEGLYDEFLTWGAKKYAVTVNGELHITVSGLSKTKAAKEIGNIFRFQPGLVVKNSGRTVSYYDDNIKPHYIEIDGVKFEIRSSLAIVDTTYTLGVTDIYEGIMQGKHVSHIRKIKSKQCNICSSVIYDPD